MSASFHSPVKVSDETCVITDARTFKLSRCCEPAWHILQLTTRCPESVRRAAIAILRSAAWIMKLKQLHILKKTTKIILAFLTHCRVHGFRHTFLQATSRTTIYARKPFHNLRCRPSHFCAVEKLGKVDREGFLSFFLLILFPETTHPLFPDCCYSSIGPYACGDVAQLRKRLARNRST